MIEDLYVQGLRVAPAPRRPVDFGIRVINNMLADDRLMVNKDADRVNAAFASHKWSLDGSGTKKGTRPVHDWSSHFMDAIRYGVASLFSMGPRKLGAEPMRPFAPDQWGYIEQQMMRNDDPDPWGLGQPDGSEDEIKWEPVVLGTPKEM